MPNSILMRKINMDCPLCDENLRNARNAYRKKHGLSISDEK